MGVITGIRYPFSDTANVAIDMSGTLDLLDDSEVKFLQLIGKAGFVAEALKHEWLEESLLPLDNTNKDSGDLNNTTDPLTFDVPAGTGVYYKVGQILLVESEQMRITVVSTDDLTVARGFGGLTTAAHTGVQPIAVIGSVSLSDAAQSLAPTLTTTNKFNYVQLFELTIKTTTLMQSVKKYVDQNDLDAQITRYLKVVWKMMARQLYHGRKVAWSAGVAGAMDGILVSLTSNAYAKGGAYLVEDFVQTAMKDVWVAGGQIDTIVCNAFQKQQIDKFLDSQRMTTRTDRTAGVLINSYETNFGTADIVLDRQIPADTVLLVDRKRIKFGPLKDHALSVAPVETSTRLTEAVQFVGAYTAEVHNQNAHAKITGLATS